MLVHGGAGTWRLWRPVLARLEERHAVFASTLTGHWGGPDLPPGSELSIDVLVDGVERDLDEAGIDCAHMAGGSLGAWVALELAKRGRARSVVAIAPGGGWGPGSSLEWKAVANEYRLLLAGAKLLARRPERWSRSPLLRRLLYWHHFAHPERMEPDDCAHMVFGIGHCAPLLGTFLDWGDRHGGARDLHLIDCPVRLAFPEKDRIVPKRFYGRRLIDALPDADVVDLPDVGHVPMSDDPELVARTILDFTARVEGGRPAGVGAA